MKNIRRFLQVLVVAAGAAWAQPVVFTGGAVNAASFARVGLPNSSIARGSMFTVFGASLGVTSNLNDLTFPLQPSMLGTSIKVTVQGTTVDAIMIYTSPGQVIAILPSSIPEGLGQLTLTFNGQTSAPIDVNVVASSFGSFTQNTAGSGPATVQNYIESGVTPVNTLLATAHVGQVVTLWGTGLGPVTGDEAAGPLPGDLRGAIPVEVYVGNKLAKLNYAGRSGCCAGVDQLSFEIPDGVDGCYVSLAVKAGGVVSNITSISVASDGAVCSDADGLSSTELEQIMSAGSFKVGAIDLNRFSLNLSLGGLGVQVTSDLGNAIFGLYSSDQLVRSLGFTQTPSVGSCAVAQFLGLDPLPVDPTMPTLLNAGASLTVTGPKGAKNIPRLQTGIYTAVLGGIPLDEVLTGVNQPTYLDPGLYTVTNGAGSAAQDGVGAFTAQITTPSFVTWTNEAQISAVQRSQDLEITWSGGDPNTFVLISGIGSVGGPSGPAADTPGALFLCAEHTSAQRFVVPSFVLQTLPATPTNSLIPSGFLVVGNFGAPVRFTAPGLDLGLLTYESFSGKNVNFQ